MPTFTPIFLNTKGRENPKCSMSSCSDTFPKFRFLKLYVSISRPEFPHLELSEVKLFIITHMFFSLILHLDSHLDVVEVPGGGIVGSLNVDENKGGAVQDE